MLNIQLLVKYTKNKSVQFSLMVSVHLQSLICCKVNHMQDSELNCLRWQSSGCQLMKRLAISYAQHSYLRTSNTDEKEHQLKVSKEWHLTLLMENCQFLNCKTAPYCHNFSLFGNCLCKGDTKHSHQSDHPSGYFFLV